MDLRTTTPRRLLVIALTATLIGGGTAGTGYAVTVDRINARAAAQAADLKAAEERLADALLARKARIDAAVEKATATAQGAEAHLAEVTGKLDEALRTAYTADLAALQQAIADRDEAAIKAGEQAVKKATATADEQAATYDAAQAEAARLAAEAEAARVAAEQAAAEQAAAQNSRGTRSGDAGRSTNGSRASGSSGTATSSGGASGGSTSGGRATAGGGGSAAPPPSGDGGWTCGQQPNGDYISCGGTSPAAPPQSPSRSSAPVQCPPGQAPSFLHGDRCMPLPNWDGPPQEYTGG